jgi:hypothetical protein
MTEEQRKLYGATVAEESESGNVKLTSNVPSPTELPPAELEHHLERDTTLIEPSNSTSVTHQISIAKVSKVASLSLWGGSPSLAPHVCKWADCSFEHTLVDVNTGVLLVSSFIHIYSIFQHAMNTDLSV